MNTKVEWVILYQSAPSNMGGNWSEIQRQYFVGTEKEAEQECEKINVNWASVQACFPVESSPTEKKRCKKELEARTKRDEKKRLADEKRALEIAAHKPIDDKLYPAELPFFYPSGENPAYYPTIGDCFLLETRSIQGNSIISNTRCFELVNPGNSQDWFVREIEIAPDAYKYFPISVNFDIETV